MAEGVCVHLSVLLCVLLCVCVCADGRTVRDAVLYPPERRQRSGIKAPTDSPPCSVSGEVLRSRMNLCSGWPHYAVYAINAAGGMAGVCVCVVCVCVCMEATVVCVSPVPGWCSLHYVAVQLARGKHTHIHTQTHT